MKEKEAPTSVEALQKEVERLTSKLGATSLLRQLAVENAETLRTTNAAQAEQLVAAYAAMQEFVDRCDAGEARSSYTYSKFKSLLQSPTPPEPQAVKAEPSCNHEFHYFGDQVKQRRCVSCNKLEPEPLSAAQGVPEGWRPIETAPKGAKGYTWMYLAWGPEHDQSIGEGMRMGDRFFAAACFYCLGKDKQFEYREIEVTPTHWMPKPAAPEQAEIKEGKE